MWIKSALMTTAVDTDNTGGHIQRVGDATPFDYGNGHVVPPASFSPGLVYDSDIDGWFQYTCAIGQLQLIGGAGICASLPPIDPSDFNGPSIAVGGLAGTQTITRTVTNIDTEDAGVYRAVVSLPGFNVTVSPKTLTVPPGQSRTFTVTMTRTTAPIGAYAFGRLTWDPVPDRGTPVSSSIAVRPVPLAVPAERVIAGTSGTVTVSPGYTGTLNTSTLGLIPATVTPFNLDTDGPNFSQATSCRRSTGRPGDGGHPGRHPDRPVRDLRRGLPGGDGCRHLGLSVESNDARRRRTFVTNSAGATAEEVVTLTNPAAGTYEIYVDLFAVGGDGTATVPFHSWVIPELVRRQPHGHAGDRLGHHGSADDLQPHDQRPFR